MQCSELDFGVKQHYTLLLTPHPIWVGYGLVIVSPWIWTVHASLGASLFPPMFTRLRSSRAQSR